MSDFIDRWALLAGALYRVAPRGFETAVVGGCIPMLGYLWFLVRRDGKRLEVRPVETAGWVQVVIA